MIKNSTGKPKIGLLPLYLKLYDDAMPDIRGRIVDFYDTICKEFIKRDVTVLTSKLCRVKKEFLKSVEFFEKENADSIVTLHLAYSPSLESAEVLANTKIPLIILDTTPSYSFAPDSDPSDIMYNHGIHGVQDLCNMLLRLKKSFTIEAGHWKESDVIDRILKHVKASAIAGSFKTIKAGSLGGSFKGMGDFQVSRKALSKTIGIKVIDILPQDLNKIMHGLDENEIEAETRKDLDFFKCGNIDKEFLKSTNKLGLALRKLIARENLKALSINFSAINKDYGFDTIPFLEISKGMSNGIGYAGEGDVLTASLVGSLMTLYPEATFTEMFCADWKNNRIFLSHMAEVNISLLASKPKLIKANMPFLPVESPVIAAGRLKPGRAVLVNIAPLKGNLYKLIVCPVNVEDIKDENDRMADTIRGWITPGISAKDFLEEYSRAGGTHHLALVYGEVSDEIASFGKIMGFEVIKI
jgi:L-arabinose isomerase